MGLSITTAPLPLQKDAHGIARVGGTRITLETVITAFRNGANCEEIVFQYPSLELADVYAVIGYYLKRQVEVEAYMKEQQKKAETIRKKIELHFDPKGIVRIQDVGLSSSDDRVILDWAAKEKRILLTYDVEQFPISLMGV